MTNPELKPPRKAYEKAMGIVRDRTREGMPPRMSQFDLIGRMGSRHLDTKVCPRVIDDLVRSQKLVRYQTTTSIGERNWITLADDQHILRWIQAEAASDDSDQECIAALNQYRQQMTESTEATA